MSAEKEAEMRQNRRKKSEERIWTGGDLSNPLAGPTVRKEGQTKKGKITLIPLLLPFSVKKRGQKRGGTISAGAVAVPFSFAVPVIDSPESMIGEAKPDRCRSPFELFCFSGRGA